MKTKQKRVLYTKDQIKKVIQLWEGKSTSEIAKELGFKPQTISYLAQQIRMTGYKLPRKHIPGYMRSLISETLKELKLIK